MTIELLTEWADKFKSIVYLKGQVISKNNDIKTLSRYDKNGSHQQAILNAIKYRDEAKQTFKDKCEGYDYEFIMNNIREAKKLYNRTQNKNAKIENIEKFKNFNPFNINQNK